MALIDEQARKKREIGEKYLEFWGACIRERESRSGVYAQWKAMRETHGQDVADIVKYAIRGKKTKADDPPEAVFQFAQVEVVLDRLEQEGATALRPFALHVFAHKGYLHEWREGNIDRSMRIYGKGALARKNWLIGIIADLKDIVGESVLG